MCENIKTVLQNLSSAIQMQIKYIVGEHNKDTSVNNGGIHCKTHVGCGTATLKTWK